MLRMTPVASAKRAEEYYGKSDGGYYVGDTDLRRMWGGKGAAMLSLAGPPEFEQLKRLINGLDPHTGKQLTAKLLDNRLCGWDVTACVPKGVTSALERGDDRIQEVLWDAGWEAFAMLEQYASTRVRVGGKQEDRVTGNLIGYGVEHPETRPVLDPSRADDDLWRVMPDWDRHIHFFIPNVTYDPVEGKWKAVKFRPIMDIRKYFDRCFDTILAGKMSELGYEVETKWKPDGKYYSWDIKGIPQSVIDKNSRRSAEVEQTEQKILAAMRDENGHAPAELSAVVSDKLGATSRLEKRDDLTLEECRRFWNSRITPEEGDAIAETIRRARLGLNPKPERVVDKAVDFAMRHVFEQRSVVRWEELATTAMEVSMGSASPDDILREALKQGVIMRMKDGRLQCTTEALQLEEDGLVGFAAGGQGKVLPTGQDRGLDRTLSSGHVLNDGQWQTVTGLLNSPNRVNMVQGPAGAGKSYMLEKLDEGVQRMGQHVTYLGTTSTSVKVLKEAGFDAYTLARFLVDPTLQAEAKGGRVVVDEVSMLGHKDAVRFFDLAKRDDLKPIFVGDPMQHGSVPRGAFMPLLSDHAGIKPFRLTEIMRQEDPAYLAAASLLSEGRTLEGFDALDRMGWIKEIGEKERYAAIAADYMQAVNEKKSVLVISPTHREAGLITSVIRAKLREAGKLGEDKEFTRLVQVNTSEAERGRAEIYRPGDVIQFQQNAEGHTKGDRVIVTDPAAVPLVEAAKFSLYRPEKVMLAAGDMIRFTGTVKTLDGEHTLGNGDAKTVAGFTKGGNLKLDNGWVVSKDAGHFRPGFVETSFGSQGRTVKRVIIDMSTWSLPAINMEQLYVSASRGKENLRLYTDNKAEIRDAVQESSRKLTALDLVGRPKQPKPKDGPVERLRKHLERKRRRGVYERMRAAWWDSPSGRSTATPPHTPPRTPPSHRERVEERQAERDSGRGR